MPARRHTVNVMSPPFGGFGDDGQPLGAPAVYIPDVPCSIETLGGSEPDVAGQLVGITTYRVQMYGDPDRPLTTQNYLTLGARRLDIQSIDDKHQNGRDLTLICGEQR